MSTAFGGRILDTSAILAVASGSSVYAQSLLTTAVDAGVTLALPAAAFAAAWGTSSPAGRMFMDLMLDLPVAVIDPLDTSAARRVGRVLARNHAPVDLAQVVACGRARGWAVITADPAPLRTLAPDIEIEPLP